MKKEKTNIVSLSKGEDKLHTLAITDAKGQDKLNSQINTNEWMRNVSIKSLADLYKLETNQFAILNSRSLLASYVEIIRDTDYVINQKEVIKEIRSQFCQRIIF